SSRRGLRSSRPSPRSRIWRIRPGAGELRRLSDRHGLRIPGRTFPPDCLLGCPDACCPHGCTSHRCPLVPGRAGGNPMMSLLAGLIGAAVGAALIWLLTSTQRRQTEDLTATAKTTADRILDEA